jgi:2-oxoglutarate dehydrogenase E2 component (dihydrolipoamide succinyltransferase)
MSVEVKVPQLGESVVEATVGRWLKKEGDSVKAGDQLVELETDKVNVEIPAEQDGILQSILKQEGETVNIGDAIATIEPGAVAATPSAPAASPAATDQSVTSPDEASTPENGGNGSHETTPSGAAPAASPVAKALAADNQLDLRLVTGTGPGGKITKEDVANYIERRSEAPATANKLAEQSIVAAPSTAPPAAKPVPAAPVSTPAVVSGDRPEERVRMSRRRQTIMVRLKEAQNTAAMLTTFNEIDMSAVMDVRKRRKDVFKERYGVNLGFMSFFTKAVVGALKAFPLLNAEIQGTDIVIKKYYDIGIAVSTNDGLVVPVLRDADKKTFAGIEKDIVDIATRARDGKLTLPELQGGTFTITNGGTFGSLMSTPILNTPQVGILGMHTIQERPVVREGQIVIRPMMYVALSYDHRIVDGSEAVRFLVRVKELVEDPSALMLEG